MLFAILGALVLLAATAFSSQAAGGITILPPHLLLQLEQAGTDSVPLPIAESPGVTRAIRSIGPRNLIRMRGDFGQFQGYASTAGAQGLGGLRADERQSRFTTRAPVTGLVTWDRIDHIEKRGSAAGRGALIGGVGLGLLGAVAGAALDAGFGGDEPGAAAAAGAGIFGGIGLVLGGLVGLAFPAWHVVYDGP